VIVLIHDVVATKQRMTDALQMAGYTRKEAEKLATLKVTHTLEPKRRM
jgi:hypothetical protein